MARGAIALSDGLAVRRATVRALRTLRGVGGRCAVRRRLVGRKRYAEIARHRPQPCGVVQQCFHVLIGNMRSVFELERVHVQARTVPLAEELEQAERHDDVVAVPSENAAAVDYGVACLTGAAIDDDARQLSERLAGVIDVGDIEADHV